MFDLSAIQAALKDQHVDGWLLYDFRGLNVLANRILDIPPDAMGSRRWFYFIPQAGSPRKIVHRIEAGALDHLPGDKTVYLRWQELESSLKSVIQDGAKIAMEYSPRNNNPYVSRVDAGTVELIRGMGAEVVSSGDLVQSFEAVWSDSQWEQHQRADQLNQQAFQLAWKRIADAVRDGKSIRETDVQAAIMKYFADHHLTTYHPPIVGVNGHGGDPHYAPEVGSDSEICKGDYVLIDLWAKLDEPQAVYSDLTKVGFVGDEVPVNYEKVFEIVANARDAGIQLVRERFAAGKDVYGWEVDDAVRNVIEDAGYGESFIHRTGHNIGQETHGNGAHIDNLETHEDRRILRRTCFSIEPGIYLDEFGIRSEVDVYVDGNGEVHVTGGLQTSVIPILKDY